MQTSYVYHSRLQGHRTRFVAGVHALIDTCDRHVSQHEEDESRQRALRQKSQQSMQRRNRSSRPCSSRSLSGGMDRGWGRPCNGSEEYASLAHNPQLVTAVPFVTVHLVSVDSLTQTAATRCRSCVIRKTGPIVDAAGNCHNQRVEVATSHTCCHGLLTRQRRVPRQLHPRLLPLAV